MDNLKVLVVGDVEGKFKELCSKLTALNNKSGPFDLVLAVGSFFSRSADDSEPEDLSSIHFPVPVYILGANKKAELKFYSGSEFPENVIHLGSRGLLTTAGGLTIAYISGLEAETSDGCHFDSSTYAELVEPISRLGFEGVDILVSSPWPKDIVKYDQTWTGTDENLIESPVLSKIATTLKPRYHFAGMNDRFYERQPYRNHRVLAESSRHTTRFVGLGKFLSVRKSRSLYAFQIVPMSKLSRAKLVEQSADTTEFPYSSVLAELGTTCRKPSEAAPQFFYDMNAKASEDGNRGKRRQNESGNEGGAKRQLPPAACWFCLSSPEVQKHMVVSIGDVAYLALPKGPLVGNHVLILPIGHIQSMAAAPDDLKEEIQRYKVALISLFKSQGKTVVFFERNLKTPHLQIQAVPLPANMKSDLIKETFLNAAGAADIELR